MEAFRAELRDNGLRFSMDDLAVRLGVSKKTIYKYYLSKADILDVLVEQTLGDMEKKAAAIIEDPDLSFVQKLTGVMAVAPEHYDLTDIRILNDMKKLFPEQWERIDSFLQSDWEQIRGLVEEGIESGYIKDFNVPLMMKVIIASVNTTLDQKFYLENQITTEKALEDIVSILLNGILKDK